MAQATQLLSASSHPTMGDLHIVFPVILNLLNDTIQESNASPVKIEIAQNMYTKLNDYWSDLKDRCCLSVVLDPNMKLSSFDKPAILKIREFIRNIYTRYERNEPNPINSGVEDPGNSSRIYFKKYLKHPSPTEYHERDVLEEYLSSAEENCDILKFWKIRSTDIRYIRLVEMARDYLVVQATSVPSEQMFSIAKHTISPTRNRLSPENIRASLCLKSWYKLDIMKS